VPQSNRAPFTLILLASQPIMACFLLDTPLRAGELDTLARLGDGAPRGKQVADRFHLVQNLIKVVQEELAHQRHHLLMPAQELVRHDGAEQRARSRVREGALSGPLPSPRQKEIGRQRRQQKVELFRMVKACTREG
jgi:hypothetical protein